MRHITIVAGLGLLALAACGQNRDEDVVQDAMREVNVIDEAGLSDVMLTVGDPEEAVAYFSRAKSENPGRVDLERNYAKALNRASRNTEAISAWEAVVANPQSTADDRVELAGACIRISDWGKARGALDAVPPTHETFNRYRYEAMVADAQEQWDKADNYYETAVGLTTTPAGVLNNWGFSKMSRGDYRAAERLFADALRHEPNLFTAKNNLVMARGAQRNYDLPVIPMSQQEKAQLFYTLALAAIKQNDIAIGRSLLEDAVETSPTYFEEASRALDALGPA